MTDINTLLLWPLSLRLPPIINIVWTLVEFWCATFALPLRIKHAMSWPFVCSDFHSAGSRRGLETLWKHSFLWKTHHSDIPYWDSSLSCFSAPFWVSIDHVFIRMPVALFDGKVKLLSTKNKKGASSALCIDLFGKDALAFCLCLVRCTEILGCGRVDLTSLWLGCPVLFF